MAGRSENSWAAFDDIGSSILQFEVLEQVREAGSRNSSTKRGATKRSQADWDAEADALRQQIIRNGGIPYCPEKAARIARQILHSLGEKI